MIQRIQTIFFFLSAGALGGLFALPLATSATKAAAGIFQDGIFNVQDNLIMVIIVGLAILISVIAIFLFKNRPLQMNMARAALFVVGAFVGYSGFEFFNAADTVNDEQFGLGLIFPIVAVVLLTLAYRAIKKDHKLVKSMDRLR